MLGAYLGSFSKSLKVLHYTWRYFFVKSNLEGSWHSYHWTYLKGSPVIVASKVKIKKGIFHRYTFVLNQDTSLSYRGTGVMEADHIIFTIKGHSHEEKTICRFPNILPSTNIFYGLWLSFDHDKKIASGGIMISKDELDTNALERYIRLGIKSEKNAILMHVQATPNRNKLK